MTACRKEAGGSNKCDESVEGVTCYDRYDVLTEVSLEKCKSLCGLLMKSCYGLEFHPSGDGGRCELWKTAIGDGVAVEGDYECFTSDGQSADAEDAVLVLQLQVELGGADAASFADLLTNETKAPWLTDLVDKVKGALDDAAMKRDKWAFTMDGVTVAAVEGSDPPVLSITIEPSKGALELYAYLRPANKDFKDMTEEGGVAALMLAITNAMTQATVFADLSGGGTITPTIKSRMLTEKSEVTPAPSPSSAPSPGPSPSPDTNTDGATRCWSPVALLLTTWAALALR